MTVPTRIQTFWEWSQKFRSLRKSTDSDSRTKENKYLLRLCHRLNFLRVGVGNFDHYFSTLPILVENSNTKSTHCVIKRNSYLILLLSKLTYKHGHIYSPNRIRWHRANNNINRLLSTMFINPYQYIKHNISSTYH